MPLMTQEKGSLYGGVSQRDPSQRAAHQVEEMQNCMPTLDQGTRLRNPSLPIVFVDLNGNTTAPTFPDGLETVFIYEYDRGEVALETTTYAFIITDKGGLEIIDMSLTLSQEAATNASRADTNPEFVGTMYREGLGINYASPDDKNYLTDIQGKGSFAMTTVKDVTYVTNKNVITEMSTGFESSLHTRQGYLWIKQAEPTTGWKYGCSIRIKKTDNTVDTIEVPLSSAIADDTTVVATTVGQNIANTLGARATVNAVGSLIRVQLTNTGEELLSINASDSYGDTASFGWGHKVDYQNQLPNSVGWFVPVVKVGDSDKSSFWLTHDDGRWKEYYDPSVVAYLNNDTMPRVIERKYNANTGRDEYYVSQFDWDKRLIGDDNTNPVPSFIGKSIKDLFFFRNRLGFMSENSISLSEAGFYGNFFRASVATLLDSDRIDAVVESLKAVNLEYAILLEDSVVLFADKAQFRFRGGQILSPTSHEVTQELAYDVNISIRPLHLDDKIFFIANRGINAAMYEMHISNSASQNSYAIDITMDCQTYLDSQIDRLSGSSVHGMVFATSHKDYFVVEDPEAPVLIRRNHVFAYTYKEIGNERLQSAWHKWTLNGDMYLGFALGTNFYSMIKRENPLDPEIWILSTGEWSFIKEWKADGLWLMSPESLERQNQLEAIPLQPFTESAQFLDNYNTVIDGYIEFGEWMYGTDGKRSPRGALQFRTIQLRISDDSKMNVIARDVRRTTERIIEADEVKMRKPYIGGNAENVRLALTNTDEGNGFRLDVVSYEGTLTKRARSS